MLTRIPKLLSLGSCLLGLALFFGAECGQAAYASPMPQDTLVGDRGSPPPTSGNPPPTTGTPPPSSGNPGSGGPVSNPPSNGSNLWTQLPDPFHSNNTTFMMTLISHNGALYVGGAAGIAKSTNSGQSWTSLNAGLPTNPFITALIFNTQGELVAAVGDHPFVNVYRLHNGSWLPASGISASIMVTSFTLDKTGALIAVTAWGGDVFRSTDGGATFTKIAANVGSTTPGSSAGAMWVVSTAPDGTLYTGGEPWGGLYHSTDNGHTWQNVGLSYAQGYGGNLLAIGYDAANDLLVSRPSNGYAVDLQQHLASGWTGSYNGLPPYEKVTSIVRNAKGEVFVSLARDNGPASTGGVYVSYDNGVRWQPYSTGLPGKQTRGLAFDAAGHLYVIVNTNQPTFSAIFKTTGVP